MQPFHCGREILVARTAGDYAAFLRYHPEMRHDATRIDFRRIADGEGLRLADCRPAQRAYPLFPCLVTSHMKISFP